MWNSYLPLEAGSYLDSSIPELYGQELADEFQRLHGEWTRLKNGIRIYLGEKSIHADTRVHYTTKRLLEELDDTIAGTDDTMQIAFCSKKSLEFLDYLG